MKIEHVYFDHDSETKWNMPLAPTRYNILILAAKGKADYHIAGVNLPIAKGDCLFISQGVPRSRALKPGEKELPQLYSVHFKDSSPNLLTHLTDEPFKCIRPTGYDYLKQRFSMLSEYWIGRTPCYEMIAQGIVLELLGLMQNELVAVGIPSSRRHLASRIQQYIVKHHRTQIRLQDLAEHVDRSPNYISSVFKEVTGRTPMEYMHEIRINSARELLLASGMTIGEIADYLGYCDQTYFNYMYKKIVGQPPSYLKKGKSR